MCGRLCCTLCKEIYQKGSTYYDNDVKKFVKPPWDDKSYNGHSFQPSSNIAPTQISPVLIYSDNFETGEQIILRPMIFGLIPSWQKKDESVTNFKPITVNARIESLFSSKLYQEPLDLGNRCVIVCDGFYEWNNLITGKQPYLFYSPENDGLAIEKCENWTNAEWNEETGWNGPKLLFLAGIWSCWTSPSDEQIYSFAVVTMPSNSTAMPFHHRMPAVLKNSSEIKNWLNYKNVSSNEAIKSLEATELLSHHMVSMKLNNTKNKDINLIKPCHSQKITSWFKVQSKDEGNKKRVNEEESSNTSAKKLKK